MLDADVHVRTIDGSYKVSPLKWKEIKMSAHILEIADGVRKLANVDNFRFRYYKNFKSNPIR